MKNILLAALMLLTIQTFGQLPDTIKLTKTQGGTTFKEFEITRGGLQITFPGTTDQVTLGPHGPIFFSELGIVNGYHIWGFSQDTTLKNTYAFRAIMTDLYIGVEVLVPSWHATFKFGNAPEILYLQQEPWEYTRYKSKITENYVKECERLLLTLFRRRFPSLEEMYCPLPIETVPK